MSKNDFFFDLHIHPNIKCFNSGHPEPIKSLWDDFEHETVSRPVAKLLEKSAEKVAKYTQSTFQKLLAGNVKAASISLYPIERGFIDHRNIPKVITSNKARNELMALISGSSSKRVEFLQKNVDYFKELNDEYNYVVAEQRKRKYGVFRLVNNFNEMIEVANLENGIAGIISIEGAHSLFDKKMLHKKTTKKEKREQLLKNIGTLKEWEYPPFFMTFSHHFWNGLAGHSKSIFGTTKQLLNQNQGLDKGINGLGAVALREMLSSDNGKRILIDTKHMSVKSRIEYYKFVKGFNRIAIHDKIPIIQSHASPNGFKTIKGSLRKNDSLGKFEKTYLHSASINISDEELEIIHNSAGIVGIILNKERLGGGKFFNSIKNITDETKLKAAYVKLLWDNIFHCVKVLNTKTAWDLFCIGSDWDGAISHIDFYDSAQTIPNLYNDMLAYLDQHKYEKKYWFGYNPKELLDKIFTSNALMFLEKNFK